MNWQLFFSFRGRINRAPYWLVTLVNFAIFFALMALAYLLGSWFFIVPALFLVPMLISAFAIMVKRLHDRDKSAWWLLFFYVLPAVLSGMQKVLRPIPEMTASFLGLACAIVGGIISIWGLVEFGFLRGTIGPNRYGPDPLA